MAKTPTMVYRAPQEGDDVFESMDGPVAFKVLDMEEGEAPPSGWVSSPADIGSTPVAKRGRPKKVETVEDAAPEQEAE